MLYVQTALLFGVSFGLYQLIDGNSVFQLIKYINLIPFQQVNSILPLLLQRQPDVAPGQYDAAVLGYACIAGVCVLFV